MIAIMTGTTRLLLLEEWDSSSLKKNWTKCFIKIWRNNKIVVIPSLEYRTGNSHPYVFLVSLLFSSTLSYKISERYSQRKKLEELGDDSKRSCRLNSQQKHYFTSNKSNLRQNIRETIQKYKQIGRIMNPRGILPK